MRRVEDDKDTAAYRELDKIVPHADIIAASELITPEQTAELLNYLWWHYNLKKSMHELSETYIKRALEIAEKHYEPGHEKIAIYQSNLAAVLQALGKYEAAEMLLREVVESFKKNLGADHPNVATVQHNLATVLKDTGKDEQAIQLEQEAYHIRLAALGPEHPNTKIAKENLDKWRGKV